MSLERPIEKAKNATEKVVSDTKTLCPWLPDPESCPHCKVHMDALEEYVSTQAMVIPVWKCPECEYRAYRHRD